MTLSSNKVLPLKVMAPRKPFIIKGHCRSVLVAPQRLFGGWSHSFTGVALLRARRRARRRHPGPCPQIAAGIARARFEGSNVSHQRRGVRHQLRDVVAVTVAASAASSFPTGSGSSSARSRRAAARVVAAEARSRLAGACRSQARSDSSNWKSTSGEDRRRRDRILAFLENSKGLD